MPIPESTIMTDTGNKVIDLWNYAHFEKKYIAVRNKENRLYPDEVLKSLPDISANHPLANEWAVRKKELRRLIDFLEHSGRKEIRILEVGCGNGWLSHALSGVRGAQVLGIDINFTELQQATRVFFDRGNLKFVYGGLDAKVLEGQTFDFILFASSIQYFPFIGLTMAACSRLLATDGEIHVLGSPLYEQAEIAAARQRTKKYYQDLGYPEMADFYFHHGIGDFDSLSHKILHSPKSWIHRILRRGYPFFWIQLKKD